MGLFISGCFFGVPRSAAVAFARLLDSPELLTTAGKGSEVLIRPGDVASPDLVFTEPLDVIGKDDGYSRQEALHHRPSLKVEGTLVLGPEPGSNTHIYVDTLDLEGGM